VKTLKNKVTLKEVAKLAGVSTATVSNVLNDSKYVSEELKRQVLKVVEALNYSPNDIAKSLRVKESKLIGLMISDISNPFFSSVVRGIEDTLSENQYNVLLCNTDLNVQKEKMYLKILLGKRIDGLIISASGKDGDYFNDLKKIGAPLVFLNRCPEHLFSDIVMTDNIKGSYMATEHLIKHGYHKIGMIAGPQEISTGRDRLMGFHQAIKDYGLEEYPELVKVGQFTIQSGYDMMRELKNGKVQPDALLVANNLMTLGVLNFIQEYKIDIPKDIALIGFDDPEWATIVSPSLTAIRQPAYDQGNTAANLLLERLKGRYTADPRRLYLDPSLIIRKSCGCT
jgi:DNA-binding LacI/PurR family transcriptional regulator